VAAALSHVTGSQALRVRAALLALDSGSSYCYPPYVDPLPACWFKGKVFEPLPDLYGPPVDSEYLFVDPTPCVDCHSTWGSHLGLCFLCAREAKLIGLQPGAFVCSGLARRKRVERLIGGRIYGYLFPRYPVQVTARTLGAEQRAAAGRQCARTPEPDPFLWESLRKFANVKRGLRSPLWGTLPRYHKFTDGQASDGTNLTFEKWNAHFPASRRKQHLQSYLSESNYGMTPELAKKWCKIDLMPKVEKLIYKYQEYDPRAISVFQPRVTAYTGPSVTAFQNWLHGQWDGEKCPILFAAGCSTTKLDEFFERNYRLGRKCFMADQSNYDSTVSHEAQAFADSIYEEIGFEEEPYFKMLRNAQGGFLDGTGPLGTRFRAPPSEKSGAADTCAVNSPVDTIVHLFCIAYANDITDEQGELSMQRTLDKVSMMVMGDDSLGFVDGDIDLKGVPQLMYRLGFIPKFFECDPEDAVFLNMIPYPVGDGHRFAPKLGRLMSRLGVCVAEQLDPIAYSCAVGKGFVATCAHVPVLRSFVSRLARLGARDARGVCHNRGLEKSEGFRRRHMGFFQSTNEPEEAVSPTARTFQFMQKRYGWSRADIAEMEATIDRWPDPPAFVGHQKLEEAILLDCLG